MRRCAWFANGRSDVVLLVTAALLQVGGLQISCELRARDGDASWGTGVGTLQNSGLPVPVSASHWQLRGAGAAVRGEPEPGGSLSGWIAWQPPHWTCFST